MDKMNEEIAAFLEDWANGPEHTKKAFSELKAYLEGKENVVLSFLPRPGVTYSLRARHREQTKKPLFVMVDVIEDDPRWLSVCFYGEMITDPEEKGDFVPGGLLGEDGCCFDINQYDENELIYIRQRLDEASSAAAES